MSIRRDAVMLKHDRSLILYRCWVIESLFQFWRHTYTSASERKHAIDHH